MDWPWERGFGCQDKQDNWISDNRWETTHCEHLQPLNMSVRCANLLMCSPTRTLVTASESLGGKILKHASLTLWYWKAPIWCILEQSTALQGCPPTTPTAVKWNVLGNNSLPNCTLSVKLFPWNTTCCPRDLHRERIQQTLLSMCRATCVQKKIWSLKGIELCWYPLILVYLFWQHKNQATCCLPCAAFLPYQQ